MEITLSPELEAVVQHDMASGLYRSVDEYIAEAVEVLHERRQWIGETLAEERTNLAQSLAQADKGELLDEDEVRRRMRVMKAEWTLRQAI